MSDLRDLNPVTDDEGDRWSRSADGRAALDRMLARTETGVGAESPAPRRRSPARLLVPATILALVVATLVFVRDDPAPVAAGDCPVTIPEAPYFVPPDRFPAVAPDLYESAWYGTADLFTMVPFDGRTFSANGDKLFYWSRHFSSAAEDYYEPALTVTAMEIGGTGDPVTVVVTRANNGSRSDIGTFMVTGMVLPETGCWRLTAEYRGAELTYVVSVPEA